MIKEMKTVKGKEASGGYAEGKLVFYRKEKNALDTAQCHTPEKERARLNSAMAKATAELEKLEAETEKAVGREEADVFLIHRMMLNDADFVGVLEGYLEEGYSAEYAASRGTDDLAAQLASSEDDYMKARALDIRDVGERLLFALQGKSREILPAGSRGVILCAEDLTPGETVLLEKGSVAAFVMSAGSGNSHTAILARSMGIPAIVGVGESLFTLPEGELALVNAKEGALTVCPDASALAAYRDGVSALEEEKRLWEKVRGKKIVSKDGHTLLLYGNIGTAQEAEAVLAGDGEGVGLFRSEFLFLGRKAPPSEEEQFLAYKTVLEKMDGRRVVIRTLDVGADKQVPYFSLQKEENPALGLRGIRLCLENQGVFRTQLRALLRASVFGKLAILFPMIVSVGEVVRAKDILREEAKKLEEEGIAYAPRIELGIMIETPAAALISDNLAKEVDFFSVGTNDLSQYALAIDRQNAMAAAFFDPHHEAVMKLIETAAENAHKNGIWIGICGELASDLSLSARFLSMRIDELSVSPSAILPLRARLAELAEEG